MTHQIKNAKDAAWAIFGFVIIGGIAIPGIIEEVKGLNQVNIAMPINGEEVTIGRYDCGDRTFNPSSGSTLDSKLSMDWADEREVYSAIGGGDLIGGMLTNALFNRFDEICDAR
jgi:hypothetical protein